MIDVSTIDDFGVTADADKVLNYQDTISELGAEIEEYLAHEDDFDLEIYRIQNINYLSSLLDEGLRDRGAVRMANDVFCSLFIIGNNNCNLRQAKSLDIEFIETTMNSPEIEVDGENLIKLLDLAVSRRVTPELNELLVQKCLEEPDPETQEQGRLSAGSIVLVPGSTE